MSRPITFPPGAFRRRDEEDDRVFYTMPRLVVHLDDAALGVLTALYARLLPPRGNVLDLMSSWRSHLPPTFDGTVIGLGLNREEMRANPRLAQALIHDVNRDPILPFNDAAFDAVLCAVSVQYLTKPVEIFREVRRTLRAGGPFVVSFSNRCFPDKAIALWHAADDGQHAAIVAAYFAASADDAGRGWGPLGEYAHTPVAGDPLWAMWASKAT